MKGISLASAATLALSIWAAAAPAADAPPDAAGPAVLPRVEVSAVRDPVEKSYRKIVRGMDLFEKRRSLAPNATLRFKLLPRSRDTHMQAITVEIVAETVALPVPVASDNTFTLERSARALAEDAVVAPNRKARSLTWRTEIRTPGLAPNTRRLGDLRLECLVGEEAGLISDFLPIFGYIAKLLSGGDYCNQRNVQYLFFADRPLFGVTLVSGNRREVLSVDKLYAGISRNPMTASELQGCDCQVLVDRTYYAPLGDRSWPDDTLLEFEYMDDAAVVPVSGSPVAPGPSR
jgi:hypothetical protein